MAIAKLAWLEHSQLDKLNEYINLYVTLSKDIHEKKRQLDRLFIKRDEEQNNYSHYTVLIQQQKAL